MHVRAEEGYWEGFLRRGARDPCNADALAAAASRATAWKVCPPRPPPPPYASYGPAGWTPVVLHVKDDFARSLAAYRLADVALVNPIRDGMNLVARSDVRAALAAPRSLRRAE